jgi:hypothetical protein
MGLFSKPENTICSKIIFHASTLGFPERQQLGKATLSAKGFELHIPKTKQTAEIHLDIPLARIDKLRAFQKKTYSSIFYVIQVDFHDETGQSAMVSCELRVFLRRGQTLLTVQEWKKVYQQLCKQTDPVRD